MEKVIEELENELRNVVEGKQLEQKRKEVGDCVDIRLYRLINFALQWTSVGYQSALRLAGMKIGRRLGESSTKGELSLVLEEIKQIIEFLKWGKIEIEIMIESKGALVKIYEPCLTSGIPHVFQNLCFFEEGFLEGYLDGAIVKNGSLSISGTGLSIKSVSVEEIRCIGLGDEFCGFLIKF